MQLGHSAVPFSLTIPDWLPESAMHKEKATSLAVLYFLIAQLDPRQDDLYADQKANVSLCRDERVIYIFNEKPDYSNQLEGDTKDPLRLIKHMQCRIGGVFGLKADSMESVISIPKDVFVPGESLQISLYIDNFVCSRDVKCLKVKLFREIEVFQDIRAPQPLHYEHEYVKALKYECDVKARQQAGEKLDFRIPATEDEQHLGVLNCVHPVLKQLTHSLTPSQSRGVFLVKYRLDVFIKHRSKTEFGQGNFISFPIIIRSLGCEAKELKEYQE